MRAIMRYTFNVKTKIPFPEWPGIVKEYMKSMNLHYRAFRYYFEFSQSETHPALNDCPAFAPIRSKEPYTFSYLSNLEDGQGASEEEVMSLIQKIYRRYGFLNTYFIYQDVDFFSIESSAAVSAPGDNPSCFKGAQIMLYRSAIFPNFSDITLMIDLLHNGEILSAAHYREGMKRFLPNIKCTEQLEIQLSDEEKKRYEQLNQSAAPMLESLEDFFHHRLQPLTDIPSPPGDAKISLAAPLKKMCKQYGYEYVKYDFNIFYTRKRTEGGHYILLQFDMGGYNTFMRPNILYAGLGFYHGLFGSMNHASRSPSEAYELLECVFETLAEAEKALFPALNAHYPTTPDWFVPSDFPPC